MIQIGKGFFKKVHVWSLKMALILGLIDLFWNKLYGILLLRPLLNSAVSFHLLP